MSALRPYQRRDANIILAHLQAGRCPLYQLPTRGGKTAVAVDVVGTVSGAAGWEVGFFVHRVELLKQASAALRRGGVDHGVIMPGHGLTSHRVHVASIDTVLARLAAGDKAIAAWILRLRLIVADEAHHFPSEKWQRIRRMAHALLFGVTATPYRFDGLGLGPAGFNVAVKGPTMRQLQAMGFLAPFEVYAPPTGLDLTKIPLRGGDFAQDHLQAVLDNPAFVMMAARAYARFAAGEGCVVFGAGVAHAEHMAEGFRRAGWSATSIDGTTADGDRAQALADLAESRLHALLSCDLISEGVDLPAVAAAILGRLTKSTQLYMQQAGRPLTPHVDKGAAVIVDLVGNVALHGMPDADRPWSLDGGVKGLERQVAPTRRCIRCWRVHEWADRCAGCGALYPKAKGEPATVWHLPAVAGMRPEIAASKPVGEVVKLARSRRDLEVLAQLKGLDGAWVDRAVKWGMGVAAE